MKNTKKFYLALVIFSLVGQVAWVMENMYFNVFIYKMFHASAQAIFIVLECLVFTVLLNVLFKDRDDKLPRRRKELA